MDDTDGLRSGLRKANYPSCLITYKGWWVVELAVDEAEMQGKEKAGLVGDWVGVARGRSCYSLQLESPCSSPF
jgi:hypothetical protein